MKFRPISDSNFKDLEAMVSKDRFSTGASVLDLHAKDQSGDAACRPEVVFWPETAAEVAAILKYAGWYEPTRAAIFEVLLPKYIEIQAYRSLLESSASEEAARMAAMENATKNCSELINKVTLFANKVRQASITKELMDLSAVLRR